MSGVVHDGAAVYLNADRSAVVDGDSPDAAFLLVAEGGTVHPRLADLYRKLVDADAAVVGEPERVFTTASDDLEPNPEPEQAETPKPRKKSAAKKAAAKSDD